MCQALNNNSHLLLFFQDHLGELIPEVITDILVHTSSIYLVDTLTSSVNTVLPSLSLAVIPNIDRFFYLQHCNSRAPDSEFLFIEMGTL